jgi:guanosine-3',5'-bis(diphosphate) 3'-pyrophosphohydrolase
MKNNHEETKSVLSALMLAAEHHGQQKRKSDGLPYINHLIDTGNILVTNCTEVNKEELAAAILHDILEDTSLQSSALKDQVDDFTYDIIISLTDNKTLAAEERKIDSLSRLSRSSDSAKKVKLADICSNIIKVPKGWSNPRLLEYCRYLDKIAIICKSSSPELFREYQRRKLTLLNYE